jgi:hypothetical protein
MEVQSDAWICARRCLDAAAEHLEVGDVITTGALVRAAGRYIERYENERASTAGREAAGSPFAPRRHACGERREMVWADQF